MCLAQDRGFYVSVPLHLTPVSQAEVHRQESDAVGCGEIYPPSMMQDSPFLNEEEVALLELLNL